VRRCSTWLIAGVLLWAAWVYWPFASLASRYAQIHEGMSKRDVIRILGTRFEAGGMQEVWLRGNAQGTFLPVFTWWGFRGNGRVDVAFEGDSCRWKTYDPGAHDSPGDRVRE
jgi:hypothetical protein